MNRRHDIDALRVIAFAFLILYHIGMAYVSDWGWHVKSSYLSELLQWPMLFLNRWRMALLFVISGLAIGLCRPERAPGRFLLLRSWRLLLPLAFGIVAVVPIQAYCQGVGNGLVEPGFGAFLLRYWTFRPWPPGAFDGAEFGFTWNHLWYLIYLWAYTVVLMTALPLLRSATGQRLAGAVTALRGARLLLLPALAFAIYMMALLPRFPGTNALINDWFQHAQYFSAFLIGYWFARDQGIWAELTRLRRAALLTALATFAIYAPLVLLIGDDLTPWQLVIVRALRGVYLWSALLAALGYGHAYLNRPFRWLPYSTEAVYPWYVLHQSLIVVIVYALAPLRLGPVLEPALVIAGTLLGCHVLYEYLIRRVRFLQPLFGLKGGAATASVETRAAGAA